MTTVGQGVVALAGNITLASGRRSTNIALSESIPGVETKGTLELNIAAGATVSLPFLFAAGITEVLWLYIYTPKKVNLTITGKDAVTPGPIKRGLKGIMMDTFLPGEGITALTITNTYTSPITIEYAYACLADVNDAPDYWNDAL